ncbi:hypothetical protein DFJ58DRAFT_667424 [Suillus subalutaceus]|uniref:uncharacterized protein n=1 Tax=Suillus subalutaceus TaxID=48586 RepID=UPI001B8682F1|nr:uncharacterized protein DFJ58DRAFT_667424 [Suillus subalutaceus]KAG1839994.1 hypothetical protein DFJ58DRAFT_667424 [Suillus subalutaceus]
MLNLSTLQTYLTQLLSPADTIHTALLLTPEGAIVSFACSGSSQTMSLQRSKDEVWILAGLSAEVWAETRSEEGAEKGIGMAESEVGRHFSFLPEYTRRCVCTRILLSFLGRIVVVPVDDASPELQDEREPLLLLAVNGGAEANWKTMCAKAKKLGAYLAPSVNKHRGAIEASPLNRTPAKSRTRSTTTSPGGVLR